MQVGYQTGGLGRLCWRNQRINQRPHARRKFGVVIIFYQKRPGKRPSGVVYPAGGDKPLFICEMVCPSRVGESVKLPDGESGIVTAVGWEITADNNILAGIALKLI